MFEHEQRINTHIHVVTCAVNHVVFLSIICIPLIPSNIAVSSVVIIASLNVHSEIKSFYDMKVKEQSVQRNRALHEKLLYNVRTQDI